MAQPPINTMGNSGNMSGASPLISSQIGQISASAQNQMDEEGGGFGALDFDKLLPILNKSLGWIILFILFAAAAGYLYLRWTPPTYESSSSLKIAVKEEGNGILTGPVEPDLTKIFGEIELIRSNVVYNKILDKLPLEITYTQAGKFLFTELYKTSPFTVAFEVKDPILYDKPIDVELINGKEYILKYRIGTSQEQRTCKYGQTYENGKLKFSISLSKYYNPNVPEQRFLFTLNSRAALLRYVDNNLRANVLNAAANTLQISFQDNHPSKAQDIVNAVDSAYLAYTIETKNQSNEQTLRFLDKMLDSTSKKLQASEMDVENFVRRNKTASIGDELGRTLAKIIENNAKRTVILDQEEALHALEISILENKEVKQYIPNIAEIGDLQLLGMAQSLNTLQLETRTMTASTKEPTLAARLKATKIRQLQKDALQLIQADQKRGREKLITLAQEVREFEKKFNDLPTRETELKRINRFYGLNERFYMMLIEKQADYGISKAGTVPDFQILSSASFPIVPVKPNKGSVYTVWIVIGVVAGLVLVAVRYLLQDTVVTIKEIEKNIAAPLLGVVPIYTREKLRVARMVVNNNPKSSLAESLRAIRTNIDFILGPGKKIISVTSTVASEGKTFVAINLSGVLAGTQNKVVMLDLDMRKPKLHLAFDIPNDKGMSTLLIGKHTIEECVTHTNVENIDIIPSGPTPPNPSELLLRSTMDELLARLYQTYDIILIDSPPVGLVTDGIIIMSKADLPIYVVRSEYSKRIYLKNINKLVKVNGFRNLAVILNGLDKFKTYGYGYGYGYDYYTDDDVPQGFDLSWVKNLFGGGKND